MTDFSKPVKKQMMTLECKHYQNKDSFCSNDTAIAVQEQLQHCTFHLCLYTKQYIPLNAIW